MSQTAFKPKDAIVGVWGIGGRLYCMDCAPNKLKSDLYEENSLTQDQVNHCENPEVLVCVKCKKSFKPTMVLLISRRAR